MSEAVVCGACGARIREDRKRCLRCGERLRPRAASASGWRAALSARRGPALIAGVVISLGGLVILAGPRTSAGPPTVASSSPSRPGLIDSRRRAPDDTPAPRSSPIDWARDGNIAFRDRDYTRALGLYQQAVTANPQDAESLNNLGQVIARLNRPADALAYFEQAIRLNGKKWSYRFNLAHALGQLEQWDRAVAEYRIASTLFPDDYPTLFNLGMALHHTGDEQGAIAEWQKAIALAPGEPTFHLSVGSSYERLRRPADAARAFERYLELARDAPDAERVRAKLKRLNEEANPPTVAAPAGQPKT